MSPVRMSIAALALMLSASHLGAQGTRPPRPMMRDTMALPPCPAPAMRDSAMAPRSGMMRDTTAMAPRGGMMRDTTAMAPRGGMMRDSTTTRGGAMRTGAMAGGAMRAPADSTKPPCTPAPMRDGMRRPN